MTTTYIPLVAIVPEATRDELQPAIETIAARLAEHPAVVELATAHGWPMESVALGVILRSLTELNAEALAETVEHYAGR